MSRVKPETWRVLSPTEDDAEGIACTRLDMLFSEDHFVAMLDPRLRNRLAIALAEGGAVFQPSATRILLDKTPYALFWSETFVRHIESLVWLARGKEQG